MKTDDNIKKITSQYLTIGEVSKLKHVNIKSLRYYDEIGVFRPSYIDPSNGYRYYRAEQLPMLNIISFCIEVGIPLKSWGKYLDNNNRIRVNNLLSDAKQLATEKMEELQRELQYLENTAKKMNDLINYPDETTEYIREIPERYFLYQSVDHLVEPKEFLAYLSQLFLIAREMNLKVSTFSPAGIFMDFTPEDKKYAVFFEIQEKLPPQPNYRNIEAGTYLCYQNYGQMIHLHNKLNPEYFEQVSSGTIIETDLINHTLPCDRPSLELQYLIKPLISS